MALFDPLLDRLRRRAFFALVGRVSDLIDAGSITLHLPGGEGLVLGTPVKDEPQAELRVRDWRFVDKLAQGGSTGFAQAYMQGLCDTPDLRAVLNFALSNPRWYDSQSMMPRGLFAQALKRYHARRPNSLSGAKENIQAHYDLGNAFYALWLDPSMTYSSALFAEGVEDLEAAQAAKYDRLADLLKLEAGQRILEVGCGWGGAAERLSGQHGVNLTGLTLSPAQLDYAQERVAKAGLSEKVDLRLEDYREHKPDAPYDALISIEMFEAIGEAQWPLYFEKVAEALKPGGRAALQIITIGEAYFEAYRAAPDFIQRYVFPGGMLPTLGHLKRLSAAAGLSWQSEKNLGPDYARTLEAWDARFQAAWPEVEALGFDLRFRRLWTYYLNYCAAGFADGRLQVYQLGLSKD